MACPSGRGLAVKGRVQGPGLNHQGCLHWLNTLAVLWTELGNVLDGAFKSVVFPGGPEVKNSPASARDEVSIPVQEYPMCSGTTKPTCHNYQAHIPTAHAPQEKPLQRGTGAPQLESSPCWPQLEKILHSNKDPVQPKVNKYF